jgi:DNA-3-methyladenine glycosylase
MSKAITARPILPRSFFERDTATVARQLLGKILVHQPPPRRGPVCAGRIVEVEAYVQLYQGERDRAAHADRGNTPRTRVIFGPGGHAYIYLVYGMHYCLNFVAEPEGQAGCVLIRALEPIAGIEAMRRRRPSETQVQRLCAGPGNLAKAMGIDQGLYGVDLTAAGSPLTVHECDRVNGTIAATGRVGIRHGADWPLRFYLAENKSISRP